VCYTREGRYFKTALFRREIAAALLDMTVLSRQPRRLLVAGALDAMAKKIEIEFWNALDDGGPGGERAGQPVPTLLAASISDLVYAQLDRDLDAAVADLSKGEPTPTLRDVVFSSIVGAGIVSGISGGKRQTALAHRFYFFMRARHPARAASLTHGELVAIGLVLQLAYYGRFGEAEALAARLRGWGLAASMADLGLPHDEADADACFDFLAATREMRVAGEAALPRLRQALPILF
jgi:glycerol dehydrogenase